MQQDEMITVLLNILKENAFKALGVLIAYLGFQLFSVEKIWESLVFFVLSLISMSVGTIMQADRHLKAQGIYMDKLKTPTTADELENRILHTSSTPKKTKVVINAEDI